MLYIESSIICNGTAFFFLFFLQVFRKLPQTMRKIVSLQLQIQKPGNNPDVNRPARKISVVVK